MRSASPKSRSAPHRRLTREELEIWLTVAQSIAPLHPTRRPEHAEAPKPEPDERVLPPIARRYEVPGYTPPAETKRAPAQPPALMPLERRLRQRLRRGRSDVEAVIDLHGMHQAQAHRALRGFLVDAQRDGVKLVLVVTGKGSGAGHGLERETGVLRQAVPHWLRAPDLRAIVVGFEEATPTHGGAGALYVRIRRSGRPA